MTDQQRPDPSISRELLGDVAKRLRDRLAARELRSEADRALPPEPVGRLPAVEPEPSFRPPSLLWPAGEPGQPGAATCSLPERTAVDLELAHLVTEIAPRRRFAPAIDHVLRAPLTDTRAIAYRQEVLSDILASPALRRACAALADEAVESTESFRMRVEERATLFSVISRLGELRDFADTVDALHGALGESPTLRSRALVGLRAAIEGLVGTERFQALRAVVAALLADLRDIRSVTIGVNLDHRLIPVEAVLVAVNRHPFRGSRVLDTILGRDPEASGRGIADLHSLLAGRPASATPIASPLFRDLAAILEQLARGIDAELRGFSETRVAAVAALKRELVFYAAAVSLTERLGAAGLPVTLPVIRPRGDRATVLRGAYNVNLAFRMLERGLDAGRLVVRNDADLSGPSRIAVLTGPNSGGKSVHLQAIGIAQLLAQAGMPVPAEAAEISVADAILTHYQTEERPDKEVGRLHEEAARLRELMDAVTRESLLLSSETFSSTGAAEAAWLLMDVVKALQTLGARAVFSTHLHELADAVERDPACRSGETQVANWVALFDEDPDGGEGGRPTYRIVSSAPLGQSHARAVARRLGIRFDQIVESLRRSGRLPPAPPRV